MTTSTSRSSFDFEVVVEEPGRHTGLAGDVLQRGRPVALAAEDRGRGMDDLAAPAGVVFNLDTGVDDSSRVECADHHVLYSTVVQNATPPPAFWPISRKTQPYAARRPTSQTAVATRSTESASSQPASINWNGQKRPTGW